MGSSDKTEKIWDAGHCEERLLSLWYVQTSTSDEVVYANALLSQLLIQLRFPL